MQKCLIYWFIVYVISFIIFFYSGKSIVPSQVYILSSWDIILHLIEYSILSFFVYLAFKNTNSLSSNKAIYTIIFIVIFAVLDEIHQISIPGRFFSIHDILSDSFASIVVTTLFNL